MSLEPRAGFGVRALADWVRRVSGQEEHLQGHQSRLGSALLTQRLAQELLLLGPRMYFNNPKYHHSNE